MKKRNHSRGICQITNKEFRISELLPASYVREPVATFIKSLYPDWNSEGFISLRELNRLRKEFVRNTLEEEKGRLTRLEREVLKSISEHELLSVNLQTNYQQREEKLTFGQIMADKIAEFGGSWTFIILFFVFLACWITINVATLVFKPFDAYPFILLNLILSCVAALQAPVIMMSQNRQEAKDRLRSQNDYQVNLKAELEIRQLHEKIDHLLIQQGQKLFEIQQIQIDLMDEIADKLKK